MFNIFGVTAGFVTGVSHVFLWSVLAVIPLIRGVIDVIVSRSCAKCEVELTLCSMGVTDLSGVRSDPHLLE